ncbi:uncharacterized protein LACBIDRAFT_296625 [Laccaria bicolor S238N-H82]|uniref:Predicted protein n=1 Tax=Laccaria bicolor (strain S238N-H82 / ATCC MYA-4686) TaxID=486041 RepID=B0D9A1_LACBS|nr:uncharacterized protein LACBIDRAFT_296625 [Laccaria bicolor S238N-H82]EDR08979.1 predicted protein [Laccaria bicolor S238N-H82]|eukprot:XP_001880292.1 predicted protein [Laccaria bicolor S238N-H82]
MPGVLNSICAALATRYSTPVTQIRKHVKTATITEWAKVQCVDSDEGDTASHHLCSAKFLRTRMMEVLHSLNHM